MVGVVEQCGCRQGSRLLVASGESLPKIFIVYAAHQEVLWGLDVASGARAVSRGDCVVGFVEQVVVEEAVACPQLDVGGSVTTL